MTDAKPWIDPELVAMGEWLKARGLASLSPLNAPLAECRAMLERIGAALNEHSVPLKRERNLSITGPHGMIPCRLYLPDGLTKPPVLVYAHGGSFALGSLDPWDAYLRDLVRKSAVAVLAVDYRLAPEHRFPIACDEMLAVVRYVAAEGASLGLDAKRVAVGGDSAGANLALGAVLALRDAGEAHKIAFLLLVYGVYSTDADSDSWLRLGSGAYGLSRPQVAWILENYLAAPGQRDDWRVAPLLASLHALPPAHLLVGTLDPLWDDNQALKRRLDAAGVPNTLVVYEGLNHGFIRYGSLIRTAQRAVDESATALAKALATG